MEIYQDIELHKIILSIAVISQIQLTLQRIIDYCNIQCYVNQNL